MTTVEIRIEDDGDEYTVVKQFPDIYGGSRLRELIISACESAAAAAGLDPIVSEEAQQ